MTDKKEDGFGKDDGGVLYNGTYYFRVEEFAALIGCTNDGAACGPGGVGTCIDGECRMPQSLINERGYTKIIP